MSDRVEDLLRALVEDETFTAASRDLSAEDRAIALGGARQLAELLSPLLTAIDALALDDEAAANARRKLTDILSKR